MFSCFCINTIVKFFTALFTGRQEKSVWHPPDCWGSTSRRKLPEDKVVFCPPNYFDNLSNQLIQVCFWECSLVHPPLQCLWWHKQTCELICWKPINNNLIKFTSAVFVMSHLRLTSLPSFTWISSDPKIFTWKNHMTLCETYEKPHETKIFTWNEVWYMNSQLVLLLLLKIHLRLKHFERQHARYLLPSTHLFVESQ